MRCSLVRPILTIAVLASVGLACGSSSDEGSGGGVAAGDVTIKVGAQNLGAGAFNPDTFTVSFATKQRVVFANRDRTGGTYGGNGVVHHLVSDTIGIFDTGNIIAGQNSGITFAAEGTYPYHCTIHATMKGVVILTP